MLSKLNNITVVSLFVSDASKSWPLLCPLVMKGPFPSIHAQVKFEFFGGAQGGLVENVFVAICLDSWFTVFGLVGIEFDEAKEFASVGGKGMGCWGECGGLGVQGSGNSGKGLKGAACPKVWVRCPNHICVVHLLL
nr:hypothetical protein CFP56_25396 [Quercus suber]